jgi:hypothetical protein
MAGEFDWQGPLNAGIAQITNIFQRSFDPSVPMVQTVYQPGVGLTTTQVPTLPVTQPFALLSPSTWSLTHWLLLGGGVFLAMRMMRGPRRNPRRTRRNPFPASGLAFRHNPMGTLKPLGGSASMMVQRYSANPRKRRRAGGSKVRFHGAFALKSKADAKAKQLGGWIKPFRVRGQQRYSVVTAA